MSIEILQKDSEMEATLWELKNEENNLRTEIESSKNSFWWVSLKKNWKYEVPWINKVVKKIKHRTFWEIFANCRLSKWLWSVVFSDSLVVANWRKKREDHKETYYSQKKLPWWALKIPWRHVAEDGTIRDKDWYICVAANYIPKWSQIMTTLWPGKVYDTWWMKWKWIDIYVNW